MQWSENSRKTGNVTFPACSLDKKPFQLKLGEVRILFEPSCFQGDGTEKRLTICFSGADESLKKQLADMEASIDATTSCLKDDVVRCKINIDSCRCYDETKRSELHIPPSMRGWTVNAQVHLRGKWATRQGCGLSLEVTDLQFLQEVREPPCPF